MELHKLDTEQRNPASLQIDRAQTSEIVRLINAEDFHVAQAVERVLPEITRAVDTIYGQMKAGGRLVYLGAGTSGRLGVLDAVECPPTFGVSYDTVVGLMAGGQEAFVKAKEGAEDDPLLGQRDLEAIGFSAKDVLVGIAASGRTPYVIGGMDYAASLGAPVLALVCCHDSEMSRHADITIAPLCGPEVITGSTRMKSGSAQKMVLNMLSTAVMIKLGKVYGNLMVDVKTSNHKLVQRAIRIVMQATGVSQEAAQEMLALCNHSCKTAIVAIQTGLPPQKAEEALRKGEGHVSKALALAPTLLEE